MAPLKTLLFLFALLIGPNVFASEPSCSYFFDRPAAVWEECLPLGNGHIGMMADGGVAKERITLNDISLWSGSPQQTGNPAAEESLAEIRRLLFEGKNPEAQQLMYETFVCAGEGSGDGHGYEKPYGSYQVLGTLEIEYAHAGNGAGWENYRRSLDLNEALSQVTYSIGVNEYSREYITALGDDAGVIRIKAPESSPLTLTVGLTRPERSVTTVEGNRLIMRGKMSDGVAPGNGDRKAGGPWDGNGMEYCAQVEVRLPAGGTMAEREGKLLVENASEIVLVFTSATDYFSPDPYRVTTGTLERLAGKTFWQVRADHVDAYRQLFGRVSLDLGHNTGRESLPIDRRLEKFRRTPDDPSLAALYFQFGRYLLICSSRPGSLPANLQGLWCNTIDTPWNGDYHLNINLQMNYWPAEVCNLAELHRPLLEWTADQVESGRSTARDFYGAPGWVTHVLGNVWRFTAPGEHPSWGATNTAAAWLCAHIMEHYRFNPDTAFLREYYPVMKEAARFYSAVLVEDPRSGYLVTAPTTSPENAFYTPEGEVAYVVAGSVMDNQIIRELFHNTADAAEIVGDTDPLIKVLGGQITRIKPTTVSADGRIMEWMEDYREVDPQHRHVSHLYGLYPGTEFSYGATPELAEAAARTLDVRGDKSTGWSMAWKINFRARLHQGDKAFGLLRELLSPCHQYGFNMSDGGGTYANLFCAHPPFQIDGNFGAAAGIAEMLLQSHETLICQETGEETVVIELLPALPSAWNSGHVKGLKARGGYTVDIEWRDGDVTDYRVEGNSSVPYTVRLNSPAN